MCAMCPDPLAQSDDVIARLERWELFGGVWRVIGRNEASVHISLLRCDAGEEVERIAAANAPELDEYLAGRTSSE